MIRLGKTECILLVQNNVLNYHGFAIVLQMALYYSKHCIYIFSLGGQNTTYTRPESLVNVQCN